ncbi:MAG: hypothetical protein BGO70_00565 [Bacteroidetes bacterium 43-93]|nr:serine hydrolase [Bacteroidota bacterium]OJW96213.1 MAG: hypothetical protein BGO70_00565 [Bacteroidetes bacterium 43-93]
MTCYKHILFFVSFLFAFLSPSVYAQPVYRGQPTRILPNTKAHWVDSVYDKLEDSEKIGQLFMVAAYSGGKNYNEEDIKKLISERRIGGLIFMQGTAEAQASLTNLYQQMAYVPLLIGMDAEWGLGMRLTGVANMPHSMMIGATHDTAIAYRIGQAIGMQCKRLGVHIDFAPVVDINNNPENPIINARSFGEDKNWVTKMSIAYMHGLQGMGVIACAKHFPGHGDTKVDSHNDLPTINKSLAQLDTLELYPFREMIKAGIKSVMVAHLNIPALETEPNVPTTLSKNTINGLLKTRMGFKGLVFTDALNMQGVTKYYTPGDVDVRALIAGNDMLLFSQDVPVAMQKIQEALTDGRLSWKDIEGKVKKILAAKYDAGLSVFKPVESVNITNDLNQYTEQLRSQTAKKSVTLVRDRNFILTDLLNSRKHVGYIGINATDSTRLSNELLKALPDMKVRWLPKGVMTSVANKIAGDATDDDITIVAIHNMTFYPTNGNYGLDEQQMAFIKQMANKRSVMIVLLGNAYLMKNICEVGSAIVAYEDDTTTENMVARVLLRKEDARGVLPVTPCIDMQTEGPALIAAGKAGAQKSDELKYLDFAEDAGVINNQALTKLDMFIQRAIADGATPGCRVLAAKDGKVFYDKAFGYYTYKKDKAVDKNTIYDVASVTKILATTLGVMRLYETGKLSLDKTIGDYLPWTRQSNKADLKIRDLLMHQAGLKSWIPFYRETMDAKGNLRPDLYSSKPDNNNWIQVASGLYLRGDYVDSIWSEILASPLENKGRYVYSDLDFYFLAAIVEKISGQHLDQYVDQQFYKPLGLKYITYLPLKKFNQSQIAPSENDLFFRHQQLIGYVHDQGAALFGGVAGHAGIFSTANDVAVIFQMLLNKGTYGGKRYFKKETVELFTRYNSTISRRGLAFDKPIPDADDAGPTGNRCSGYTFGHQGFTGTCVWADPATGILFVFLSNRLQPSSDNNMINKMSVRTVSQDYIYESLGFPINHERPALYKKELAENLANK